MEQSQLFLRFGVAIAIGFLIGLQREYSLGGGNREIIAGERTLALMGLTGCLAAMAADILVSPLGFVAIIVLLGVYTAVAYFIDAKQGYIGLTTETASLIVVVIGALCYWGYLTLAVALGIATTVLLSMKLETDRFVRALTREDIFAVYHGNQFGRGLPLADLVQLVMRNLRLGELVQRSRFATGRLLGFLRGECNAALSHELTECGSPNDDRDGRRE